jgi:ribosomal protein S18 acetylase RimI-like enzyme
MQIRFGTSADLNQYTDLLQKTYQQAYTNEELGLTPACFSKEIFASQHTQDYLRSHLINNDTQKTWLAFEGKELIGSVTCIIKDDREAELTGFYVSARYQGKGLGRQLYDLALRFAGQRDLILDVYSHVSKTIEMYKKWGWQLDTTKGEDGYFYRHWPEWPKGVIAKCKYMRLKR